jgi:hypothetical protein
MFFHLIIPKMILKLKEAETEEGWPCGVGCGEVSLSPREGDAALSLDNCAQ